MIKSIVFVTVQCYSEVVDVLWLCNVIVYVIMHVHYTSCKRHTSQVAHSNKVSTYPRDLPLPLLHPTKPSLIGIIIPAWCWTSQAHFFLYLLSHTYAFQHKGRSGRRRPARGQRLELSHIFFFAYNVVNYFIFTTTIEAIGKNAVVLLHGNLLGWYQAFCHAYLVPTH